MTLDPFNMDAAAIPADQIPVALVALAALQAALAARLMAAPVPAPAPEAKPNDGDRMLTVEEVAQRVRRSKKWVYRRVKTLPFARRLDNRSWVFSERGLEKWLARKKA